MKLISIFVYNTILSCLFVIIIDLSYQCSFWLGGGSMDSLAYSQAVDHLDNYTLLKYCLYSDSC